MNSELLDNAKKLVHKSYIEQGSQNLSALGKQLNELIEKRKMPSKPLTDQQIDVLLNYLSLMDSNNFSGNAGVGEREGRCFASMVRRRNYGFCHGIGRSGDITEIQPKAAGSSLLVKLCRNLTLDLFKLSGIRGCTDLVLLPVATGMALSLCLMTLRPTKPRAEYVVFLRIDQKSCFKSILTAGFKPLVVTGLKNGDEIQTNLDELRKIIIEKGAESIVCVMSTTSCFAPRVPDNLPEIGKICSQFDIAHVVNNAYGLQSSKCSHLISETVRLKYRLDAFVQSMDKNFMVPVGGSIVGSFDQSFVDNLGKMYPGRASIQPILDLFISFLSMGSEKYKELLVERKELYSRLQIELKQVAESFGERLLNVPHNDISMGITLQSVEIPDEGNDVTESVTKIGSMLFTRYVSGARVVSRDTTKEIGGVKFKGFGAHVDEYPHDYMTAAASIGMQSEDINLFMKRLKAVLSKQYNKDHSVKFVPEITNGPINDDGDHVDSE